MKIRHRKGNGKPKYWIAINEPSCAIMAFPTDKPKVYPTPTQLFGFPSLAEAQRAQLICLTSPIPAVEEEMAKWGKRRDVSILWPLHPEPPTTGSTLWESYS